MLAAIEDYKLTLERKRLREDKRLLAAEARATRSILDNWSDDSFSHSENSASDSDSDKSDGDSDSGLNAAKYLFASFRLSKRYPDLVESQIISSFTTKVPLKDYSVGVKKVSASYTDNIRGLSQSVGIIVTYFISQYCSFSSGMQDGMMNSILSVICGYVSLGVLTLYEYSPALIVVPIFTLLVCAIVLAYTRRKKLSSLARTGFEPIVPVPYETKTAARDARVSDAAVSQCAHGRCERRSSEY